MSARSRELFALIPVGLLVTAGFTAVLIVDAQEIGDLSFVFGLYFLGLCLATHLVIRARLPDADPFLFPLVALLQLVRVYAQSIRKIAEAEVRLFHLYVHEPLIRQGVGALEMAEEMEELAAELMPLTGPLIEYLHGRYRRYYAVMNTWAWFLTRTADCRIFQ